jgi:tetratricopeptide (TPR) repeat protein
MPELAAYPGSPALSAEAREKVLQTFRHTLEMARAGRNEDALLGCDFILKMDARFAPARQLLASLRGIAAGTVVDLADFAPYLGGSALPVPAPAPVAEAPPATPPAGYGVPPALVEPAPAADPLAAPGAGLDSLSFDDLAANPFAPAASHDPFAAPMPAVDFSFGDPSAAASPAPDPFAAAPASAPDAFVPAEAAPDPFAGPPPAADPFAAAAPAEFPSAPPAPSGVDPRIAQFLRQGDEAEARGSLQEAIDLWSRVFLIDLSNEDASRRIDAARARQDETARQLDVLLSEGVQLYEAGDLPSARDAFLKVLTLSESDATARNYLNEIDAALSSSSVAAAPAASHGTAVPPTPAPSAPVEPYLRDELESPGRPAFAEGLPSLDETPIGDGRPAGGGAGPVEKPAAAAGKGGKVDGRLLVGAAALVLVGVAALAWFLFRPKSDAPSADLPVGGAPVSAAPATDPIEKARTLFKEGKAEEALSLLTAVPATDPRHDQALVLIDTIKSSAQPGPAAASTVSDAEVDAARLAGFASLESGRYIDAVKSLDVVVRARQDDTEAAQALVKARDAVSALGSAIRSYNEQDYESAQRLLWDLRKQDPKNQDVEEYLFKSYFNDGIMGLQAGSMKKAAESFREAAALRPADADTQRHLRFARKYPNGSNDLLSRIYVRHVSPRP